MPDLVFRRVLRLSTWLVDVIVVALIFNALA
jgi:hypothetical protein